MYNKKLTVIGFISFYCNAGPPLTSSTSKNKQPTLSNIDPNMINVNTIYIFLKSNE